MGGVKVSVAVSAVPGTDPELATWPAAELCRFRRYETTVHVGRGDAVWHRARRDVLTWGVKTRSGFSVVNAHPVSAGERVVITAHVAGMRFPEPVQVGTVVEAADRVGFSYRTLPGHPVAGEEAFIVHRADDDVFLTIRSLTAAAEEQPWRALYPVLRIAQLIARRRYIRALR
jgi:uncharacterized protein (UPF0548 family)